MNVELKIEVKMRLLDCRHLEYNANAHLSVIRHVHCKLVLFLQIILCARNLETKFF